MMRGGKLGRTESEEKVRCHMLRALLVPLVAFVPIGVLLF